MTPQKDRTKPPQSGITPDAISVNEAIARSSLGRTTIFRAMKLGDLPSRKIGGRRLILLADLQRFLQGNVCPEGKSHA